jgi:hypothetical protein
MSEWQPIETAPRDGTDVLVYVPKPHWHYPPPATPGVFEAWYGYGKWKIDTDDNGTWVEPTHWMPLPSPPA